MHFCTPKKLIQVEKEIYFDSIRTGWIPQYIPKEIIKIINFKTKEIICFAKIIDNFPVHFHQIDKERHKEEIDRYNRKFKPFHYFFIIELEKVKK